MEKLIKLLNEYKIHTDHKNSRMSEYVWANVWDDIVMPSYVWTSKDKTLEIISKKFEFIQWLFTEDKLNMRKIYKIKNLPRFDAWGWNICLYTFPDELIMLLSIQENPIEFLISILK